MGMTTRINYSSAEMSATPNIPTVGKVNEQVIHMMGDDKKLNWFDLSLQTGTALVITYPSQQRLQTMRTCKGLI